MNYIFILVQDEGWLFLELFFCLVFLYKWKKKNEWDEFTWISWSVFTRLFYKTSCPLHINTYNITLSPVLTGTNTSGVFIMRQQKGNKLILQSYLKKTSFWQCSIIPATRYQNNQYKVVNKLLDLNKIFLHTVM